MVIKAPMWQLNQMGVTRHKIKTWITNYSKDKWFLDLLMTKISASPFVHLPGAVNTFDDNSQNSIEYMVHLYPISELVCCRRSRVWLLCQPQYTWRPNSAPFHSEWQNWYRVSDHPLYRCCSGTAWTSPSLSLPVSLEVQWGRCQADQQRRCISQIQSHTALHLGGCSLRRAGIVGLIKSRLFFFNHAFVLQHYCKF